MSDTSTHAPHHDSKEIIQFAQLPLEEQVLLLDIAEATRTIGYGSIVLTIHDGRLVEFTRTVRSRIATRSR